MPCRWREPGEVEEVEQCPWWSGGGGDGAAGWVWWRLGEEEGVLGGWSLVGEWEVVEWSLGLPSLDQAEVACDLEGGEVGAEGQRWVEVGVEGGHEYRFLEEEVEE